MQPPFERTWWVDEGNLLAGPFPGSASPDKTDIKLRALLDAGICTFVSLMEPDEVNAAGDPFAPYDGRVHALARGEVEIELHRFPIVDFGTVSPASYRRILDTIDRSIEAGRPVYVHCWGGHGRTGTVVGCWLSEHGVDGDDPLERIAWLRRHSEYLTAMESPQTEPQREVVRGWSSL
ncbi:MAG: tyrosine-protein phosphatase [Actinomycetota bacterium]